MIDPPGDASEGDTPKSLDSQSTLGDPPAYAGGGPVIVRTETETTFVEELSEASGEDPDDPYGSDGDHDPLPSLLVRISSISSACAACSCAETRPGAVTDTARAKIIASGAVDCSLVISGRSTVVFTQVVPPARAVNYRLCGAARGEERLESNR